MHKVVTFLLIVAATGVAAVAVVRHLRPPVTPLSKAAVEVGRTESTRPSGIAAHLAPSSSQPGEHETAARLDPGKPPVTASRMVVPAGSFLLSLTKLVAVEDNHLTAAAVDVLKLQPDEERTIEALLARASDEARAHRRQGQAVHRLENGSIDVTDKEADWADFLRTESSRLKDALDDESAAALQAVGLKQLLTSAHMMGLAGADPIPGQPGEMLVRVRNDGLILHQRISREALETLLAP